MCLAAIQFSVVMPLQASVGGEPLHVGRLSADELSMVYVGGTDTSLNVDPFRILMATRVSPSAPFAGVKRLDELHQEHYLGLPSLTADGLTLFVSLARNWFMVGRATRASAEDLFPSPVEQGYIFMASDQLDPWVRPDGLAIYYSDGPVGAAKKLYRAKVIGSQASKGDRVWNQAADVTEESPALTPDELALYFFSDRDGVAGIYRSRRARAELPFGAPTRLPQFDASARPAWISPDECTLYFSTGAGDFMATSR